MAKYLDENGLLYLIQALKTRLDEKADLTHAHGTATNSAGGFMSAEDKRKLDGIAAGANCIEISTVIEAASTDLTAASSKAVREYVTSVMASMSGISAEVVDELPAIGAPSVIYLVPKSKGSDRNCYDEYMWISSVWELIGSTAVDLSDYIRTSDLQALTNAEIEAVFTLTEE